MKAELKKSVWSWLLTMLLICGMCLSVSDVTAFAEEEAATGGTCGENVTWKLDSEGTLTISGTGDMTDYNGDTCPSWNSENVKMIVIEEGVTSIGMQAFFGCSSLTSIDIAPGVTRIGTSAFKLCSSLTSIDIPGSVTSIDIGAFDQCSSLESVSISSGVTLIDTYAFLNCDSLNGITIPASVETIEHKALGFYLNSAESAIVKYENFTISGYAGTAAEDYAKKHGFTFISLDAEGAGDTKKNDTSKAGENIASIDTAKGTAQVTDLVSGSNSEVPLAVVIEGSVYRMYNPNTGEHFYTKSSAERDYLIGSGWNYEENASFATIAADEAGAKPVYRVYNSNSGLHHYTMNHEEAIMLSNVGWNYEGISFYAFDKDSGIGSEQYRLYNPNDGQHHWTVDSNERDSLVSLGWNAEGTAWRVK